MESISTSVRINSHSAIFTKVIFIIILMQAGSLFAVCQALSSSYNLTGNETSVGTCFTLNANNIVLDCKGYTISITGGTAVPSIDVNNANTTIQNCVITDTSGTNVAMGAIRLQSTASSTKITNTNVSTIGHYSLYVLSSGNNFTSDNFTTTAQSSYGAYFSSSSNNVLANVLFNKTATASTYSLYWFNGDSNVFSNVTVDSSNTHATAIYAASLYGVTNSNFSNSRFISYNLQAVWLQGGSTGNIFNNATVIATSAAAAHGFYIDFSPSNSIFNSNINVSGIGIYIVSSAGGTWMENLTITSSASSGIYVASTTGNSDANIINNVNSTALNYPLSFFQSSNSNMVGNSTFISTANTAFFSSGMTAGNSFVNNTFQSRLSGGTSYAFYFTASSSSNNVIRNNTIISPTYYAIYFAGTGSNSNVIDSNNIIAAAGAGYGITFAAASSNNNNITNNNISAMGYGVQVYGDYNNVTGNSINASTIGVYLVFSTFTNISNNYVTTNNNAAANAVLYLSSSDSNTISNNTLLHIDATAARNYGIYVASSSSNEFDNNNVSTLANDGVRVTTTSNSNVFIGNAIYTNATNYYGLTVTTNCNSNRFYNNSVISQHGYGATFVTNSKYNLFYGGNIQAYTQSGFIISSANSNNITNTNITSGIGAAGSYGLQLTVTSGNRISNVTISANGSYGIYLTGGVSGNVLDSINVSSATSYALYANPDVSSNTFSNFNFTSRAAIAVYTNGNPTPITGNSFINGTIWANASSSYALYLYYSSTNNNFTNVAVTNVGATGATAIYLLQSSTGNIFTNVTANAANATGSYGILAQTGSTGNFFYSSAIVAPGAVNIYVGNTALNPSSLVMVNCSFDTASVTIGDTSSYLNVSWYLRANVTDLTGTVSTEGANVTIYDKFGSKVSSSLTDQNGLSAWTVAKEKKQVLGSSTTFYPYNFTVVTGAAVKNQTLATLYLSTTQGISMNASTCGLLTGDYLLTNNVYASAGCFQAGSPGITLDCNGYSVNYSRTGAGCAFSANSMVGVTLKNCRFVQGAYASNSSSAICLSSNANATVANSTINASGASNGYDFNLTSGSTAYALNVTTNSSNSYFSGGSSLYREWYVQVNLSDMSGFPLPVAHVNITNAYNSTVASAAVTDGQSPVMILVQYMQTGASNYTAFSNFTILGYTGASSNSTLLSLSGNANVALQVNASTCGTVSQSTTLRNSVYSTGTCLVAGASNITMDCAGYTVNYSRAGNGFYGLDTAGFSNVTVKNCNFVSGNASAAASYGIYANGSAGAQIANSTISGNAAALNSSSHALFVNTAFDNSTLAFLDSASDLSVEWYANVHVVGLAGEDVNGSQVNVTNAGGQVANATTGPNGIASFLLPEYVRNQSGQAFSDPYNFTALHPVTLMTASNYTALGGSANITLQVISASISVLAPSESQIFFQGDTVNITINVTLGQSWVTNATVQVLGDAHNSTYQAIQASPGIWGYSYNIDPSQPSATMTINARGYNGTSFVSATRHFVVTRTSGSGIAQPIVDYFCPLYTYNVQNAITSVTASADLDTVLFSMALNVTYPNGSTSAPPQVAASSDMVNYIYNYTWQVNATQVGAYTLYMEARDVNDNRVNFTRYLYASPSNATVNLSAAGVSALYLQDVCSGAAVASGSSLAGVSVAPGNYSLLAADSGKVNLTFSNFNVTSYSGQFLNYSHESASGLSTPENRRNIFLFSGVVNGGSYSSAWILFNYSADAGTLVAENSLEIDGCPSRANCSWTLLNATLNTTSKMISATVPAFGGLYGTFEPAFPTPTPQPVYAAYPVILRFSPAMQNVLLGSNVTIGLNAKLEANLSAVRVNATFPLGAFQNLTNTSHSYGANYTYNFTYPLIANETGVYVLRAMVGDQYYQNTSAVAYLNVVDSNVSASITSYGINSSALADPGTGVAVLFGSDALSGNITPGNYTYYANASGVRFTLNNLQVNGGGLQALNYSSLLPSAVAPPNRSGVYLFSASNFSLNYSHAQVTVNYSAQAGGVISEVALEVWGCPGVSDCANMTRLNATIDTVAHTASFNMSSISGVYGVFQPFLTVVTPIQAQPPAAVRFTTSRQNAVLNSNVTVYLELQLGANLSSVRMSLTRPSGGWQLLNSSSSVSGSNFTYNLTYWLIANETGNYTLTANVTDLYSQSSIFTYSFTAGSTTGVKLISYGIDNSSAVDNGTGATVLQGGILGNIPPGPYTFIAAAGAVKFNMSNLQIDGGEIEVLNYTGLQSSAVSAPANRLGIFLFQAANFSVNYAAAQITVNYSSLLASVFSEPALEVWSCASITDCSVKTQLNATIDTVAHTASFSIPSISGVYGLYQPQSTVITPVNVPLPYAARFTTSRKNAELNSNITVYLDAKFGANMSSITMNVTRPSGGWQLLGNGSFSQGPNYTYSLTYPLIANETGAYSLAAAMADSYGQVGTATASFNASSSAAVIITSYGIDNSSVVDTGSGETVLSGGSQLIGGVPTGSYTYLASAGNTSFNISQLQVGGFMSVLNYTNLSLSAVGAPANRSALYLFSASNFSSIFDSAQVTVNYSSLLGSVISEPALEIWSCPGVSGCSNMSRLNITISTITHTISFSAGRLSGVYGIYQPASAVVVTPVQVPLPQITRLVPSKFNAVRNDNVTVYMNAQLGANFSSATLNLSRPSGGWQLLNNSSFVSGSNYTFNITYWFIANETGTYTLSATVSDSYGQSASASSQVNVAAFNSSIIVTSYGLDSSSIYDPSMGTAVLSGGNVLAGSIPLGEYTYAAAAQNTTILLHSLEVNGNMQVLNYTNLSLSAAGAPANRSALYLFSASNFSINYASAQITIDYSGMLSSVVSEQALEVWECPGVTDCSSMAKLAPAIDTAAHTVSFNVSSIRGVYGLYAPVQRVSSPVNAAAPSITRFTPSLQNAVPGSNITVYLDFDLGANLSYANVTLIPPSGPAQELGNDSFSEGANNTYSLTYSFIAGGVGGYSLGASVGDIYGQNASSNYALISATPINASITSDGVDAMVLSDPAMDAAVLSGIGNMSGSVAPGNYTLHANASSVGFAFANFSVEGDSEALSFSELNLSDANISAPSNRTGIYFFEASNKQRHEL